MAHDAEWLVEPRPPSRLSRLIAPTEGSGTGTLAVGVGALAAAAFVASLALDWQKVTIEPAGRQVATGGVDRSVYTAGLGSLETLSLAYVLGSVALLALLGAVATRPELALRLRMTATGAGVGLLGVLVAVTLRLPETILGAQGVLDALFGGAPEELQNRMTTGYQPGIFFGYAAVTLPVIAIWLAGRPAGRAATAEAGPAAVDAEAAPDGRTGPAWPRLTTGPGDLRVSPAGPADLTVTPAGPAWADDLRAISDMKASRRYE